MNNHKNILSTALHDIYNEINNLFFLSESLLDQCHCINKEKKKQFQQDFFNIINQIKAKQFIFNNLHSDKPMDVENFMKYTFNLYKITYDHNIELPLAIWCTLIIVNYGDIIINKKILTMDIKPKHDNDDFWAMNLLKSYLKNYNYSIKNHIITINI